MDISHYNNVQTLRRSSLSFSSNCYNKLNGARNLVNCNNQKQKEKLKELKVFPWGEGRAAALGWCEELTAGPHTQTVSIL